MRSSLGAGLRSTAVQETHQTSRCGVAFAAIFLLSNASGVGFGLLAAVLLWVLTWIEILENYDEPGHYTAARGRLGILKLVLLLGIYGASAYGLFVIQHDFGSKARSTVIAEFAIAGLCFMLAAELWRSGDAEKRGKIWVVGHRDLVDWLSHHRDTAVDPEYARTRLLTPRNRARPGWPWSGTWGRIRADLML